MNSPYKFLNRFNKYILPIMAPFISGYVLGYMVSDNETHQKFQKYKPIAIPHVPYYNFYLYAYTDETYKKCVADLENLQQLSLPIATADLRA